MSNKKNLKAALFAAFPFTVPILAGFLFLGMSYGMLMASRGFSFLYPCLMALTIFGGSLEFVAATMLMGSFAPLQTFVAALIIQARHLFYGISMLEKYKGMGLKKIYLIFGMCDESFSINYSAEIPKNVDKGLFMFFVTLLNQSYWVLGATVGGLIGSFVTFELKGLDFVMTALFVVIFLEQWLKEKKHYTALIGLFSSVLCLTVFGSEDFLIPTMICIIGLLTVFKKPIEKAGGLI